MFKKLTRFLLLAISVFLLVSVVGTADLKTVLADADCPSDENGVSLGCANPGSEEGWFFPEPEPQPVYTYPTPAPVAPTPSCPDDHNYCDTNTNRMIHKHGGYWDGNMCVYAFTDAGSCGSAPAPQCPRIDVVRTEQDCVGDQWCTFNIWQGPNADGSCKYDRGGAYGCQRIEGRCGVVKPPTGTPEVIRTPQPAAPVIQPVIIPVQVPVVQPIYPTPPIQVAQCVPQNRQEYTCFGTQLCRFDTLRNSNCSISRQGPYDCRQAIECGFRPAPVYPTPPIIPVQPPVILPPAPQPVAPAPVVRVASAECPAGTINRGVRGSEIICETPATTTGQPVRVVQVASIQAKEMPKTGLPLLAWAALAFVPAGFKMKKVGKVNENITANYLFEDRLFKM